jgi:hypothetical protein
MSLKYVFLKVKKSKIELKLSVSLLYMICFPNQKLSFVFAINTKHWSHTHQNYLLSFTYNVFSILFAYLKEIIACK